MEALLHMLQNNVTESEPGDPSIKTPTTSGSLKNRVISGQKGVACSQCVTETTGSSGILREKNEFMLSFSFVEDCEILADKHNLSRMREKGSNFSRPVHVYAKGNGKNVTNSNS